MESTLRQVLAAVGTPLVDVLDAPAGLDVAITGLAVVDPDDEPDDHTGRLVLVIGARGAAAADAVRGVAQRGAVAIAVKTTRATDSGTSTDTGTAELRAAAAGTGAALLAVRPDARWDHVEQLARDVVSTGGADDAPDDLFTLAQTTGLLTGGLVTIEDVGSRVLAFSHSDSASADELRRLSVLGWQGPADYLKLLRDWGVFDRLRTSEDVVRVDEHAELGIRRRLAVGIHAGQRWLGTIWVQEGAAPFADRAEDVLVGAARVAAGHILRRRTPRSAGAQWSHDLAVGLLRGEVAPDLVAATSGIDAHSPVLVAAFAVRTAESLGVAELADIVAVHAAAYRHAAVTVVDGARVYAVLPDVPPGDPEPSLRALCAEVVALAWRRTGARVQAGIGSTAATLAGAMTARTEADRVLDALADDVGGTGAEVAALGDLRAEILLDATLRLIRGAESVRDPVVAALLAHDDEHGGGLADSVLAYLDALGDVRAAARRLTVHPNTLRYRLRRATAVAGLNLDDPSARLVAHLQLLLAHRS